MITKEALLGQLDGVTGEMDPKAAAALTSAVNALEVDEASGAVVNLGPVQEQYHQTLLGLLDPADAQRLRARGLRPRVLRGAEDGNREELGAAGTVRGTLNGQAALVTDQLDAVLQRAGLVAEEQ